MTLNLEKKKKKLTNEHACSNGLQQHEDLVHMPHGQLASRGVRAFAIRRGSNQHHLPLW